MPEETIKTKEFDLDKLEITIPAGCVEKTKPYIEGNKVKAVYTVTSAGTKVFKASYDNGTEVSATFSSKEVPAVLTGIVLKPASVGINDSCVATISFNKALIDTQSVDDITISADANATVGSVTLAADRTSASVTITAGSTVGSSKIICTMGDVTKEATLEITEPKAVLEKIELDKNELLINEDVVLTASFDKAPVLADIKISPSSGLVVKVEPTIVVGNKVVATYTGTKLGIQSIAVVHNGVTKTVTITVEEETELESMSVDKSEVNVGDDVTVEMEFNKELA